MWEKVKLGSLWLFPGGMFYSLEKAISLYKDRAGEDEYWKKGMFPVFGSGGGEFFLIDISPYSSTHGFIYNYCLNETDYEVIITYFDSLQSAIDTICDWYSDGLANYYDKQGPELVIAASQFRKIGRRNNPNSDFWKLYY